MVSFLFFMPSVVGKTIPIRAEGDDHRLARCAMTREIGTGLEETLAQISVISASPCNVEARTAGGRDKFNYHLMIFAVILDAGR